jgi:hypothetical protein
VAEAGECRHTRLTIGWPMLCVSRSSPVCTRHKRSVPSSAHVYNCEKSTSHESLPSAPLWTRAGLAHMYSLGMAWQQRKSERRSSSHGTGAGGSARAYLTRLLWIKLEAGHQSGVPVEQADQVAGGRAIQSDGVCRGNRDEATVS